MKKHLSFLLLGCLLLSLSGCGSRSQSASVPESTPEIPAVTLAPFPTAQPAPEPTPEPTPEPAPDPNTLWFDTYRSWLRENFETLRLNCGGFLSGVGFIDLDLDSVPEMLVFDPGASSSMGVQFFDCIDGRVECVSASSVDVGTALGGEHFDPTLYVNTADFAAFRLMEDRNGDLYFTVSSFNGSEELRYNEEIRFAREGEALYLVTLLCAQSAVDADTQNVLYTVYTIGDEPISAEQYEARLAELRSAADLGYEAAGCFYWENERYGTDEAGFFAMFEDAAAAYVPAL